MSVILSSLPGKFKCSLLNGVFCPDGITPNSGLTEPNNTYIYIYCAYHSKDEDNGFNNLKYDKYLHVKK